MYEFAPTYVDLCSLFNPGCVTSSSCDCSNTENPRIMIAGEMVTYYGGAPTEYADFNQDYFKLTVYPNPSSIGMFNISAGRRFNGNADVRVYNLQGVMLKELSWNGENTMLNLTNLSKGIYFMKVSNINGFETRKLIIQ